MNSMLWLSNFPFGLNSPAKQLGLGTSARSAFRRLPSPIPMSDQIGLDQPIKRQKSRGELSLVYQAHYGGELISPINVHVEEGQNEKETETQNLNQLQNADQLRQTPRGIQHPPMSYPARLAIPSNITMPSHFDLSGSAVHPSPGHLRIIGSSSVPIPQSQMLPSHSERDKSPRPSPLYPSASNQLPSPMESNKSDQSMIPYTPTHKLESSHPSPGADDLHSTPSKSIRPLPCPSPTPDNKLESMVSEQIWATVVEMAIASIEAIDLISINYGITGSGSLLPTTLRTDGAQKLVREIELRKSEPKFTAESVLGHLRSKMANHGHYHSLFLGFSGQMMGKVDRIKVEEMLREIEAELGQFQGHLLRDCSWKRSMIMHFIPTVLTGPVKQLRLLFVYFCLYTELYDLAMSLTGSYIQLQDRELLLGWLGELRMEIGAKLIRQAQTEGQQKATKWLETLIRLGQNLALVNLAISTSFGPDMLEGNKQARRRPTSVAGLFDKLNWHKPLAWLARGPWVGDHWMAEVREHGKHYEAQVVAELTQLFQRVFAEMAICRMDEIQTARNVVLHLAVMRELRARLAHPNFASVAAPRMRAELANARDYLDKSVELLDSAFDNFIKELTETVFKMNLIRKRECEHLIGARGE